MGRRLKQYMISIRVHQYLPEIQSLGGRGEEILVRQPHQ